ncbi:MAG: 1,4-dihydroxy-2-naphthoate polyprenyltransferase [Candidatus Dormibacteria bacterium]
MTAALSVPRIWWHASRPATLAASISPVVVGLGVAAHLGSLSWGRSLAALGVAVALQFGVNYANDYSDFKRGADQPGRLGPPRAASSGLVAPQLVLAAAVAAFVLAAAIGVWLCSVTSWWLLAVGAACLLAAWLYTGGPRPYGYRGFGELAVFVFFGLVATCGTVYVEIGWVGTLAVLAAILPGALAAALLLVNNIRDIATDAAVGKRTLAVILGPQRSRRLLLALLGLALAVPLLIALPGIEHFTVFLPWLVVPTLDGPLRNSSSEDPGLQVRALQQMGAVLAASSVLLALGIWAG